VEVAAFSKENVPLAEHNFAPIQPEPFVDRVYESSKAAFSDLIRAHPDQNFYAFALFTDDSLQFLYAAANTEEALTATVHRYREKVDPKYGTTLTRSGMRWSYGDWGFFPYEGGNHFGEINGTLSSNFDRGVSVEEFDREVELLWNSVLDGFRRLELEGFFGTGPARSKVTLLVVGYLSSDFVNSWVSALNPPDVADQYINWNADAPDDESE
jgi:Domain of unknown function (DUF4303)